MTGGVIEELLADEVVRGEVGGAWHCCCCLLLWWYW